MCEAQMHDQNCFVTLTYDEDHCPEDYSLRKRDFQLFMKKLRKEIAPKRVRFFHCGEYGEEGLRPHYHALLFGFDFPDRVFYQLSASGSRLYTSETLSRIWGMGRCDVGDVTFESAAYVARYVVKKVNGDEAAQHYERVLESSGEVVRVVPEYATMSRRPGIGASWFDKFQGDVYPEGQHVARGRRMQPARYFDQLFERVDPVAHSKMKQDRESDQFENADESTPERLRAREVVKKAQVSRLKRELE